MEVIYLDHFGSDLMVVNSARVSFGKRKEKFDDKDARLIKYLAKHNHWMPFAHPKAQFHLKAPIFVARQLAKHQVGMEWSEISRRYVDYEPEFYVPEVWRKRAEDKKQGSSDEAVNVGKVTDVPCIAAEVYAYFIKAGVCPEQARMVLPQSTYTEWYWTGSLAAWARVCNLRCMPDTQEETRVVANQISDHMQKLFPVSWEALKTH